MQAQENRLLPFLNGKKQFIIPMYQRTYSWTQEQCEQLWNDIVRTATNSDSQTHFLGSVVYIQDGLFIGDVTPLLVIDGQQRLTTLMLLLTALAKAAHDPKGPSDVSHDDIYESYLINRHSKGERRYKLLLTQSDKETLIKIIDAPEQVKSSLKTPSRLVENYLFFEEQIRKGYVDLDTVYKGIGKMVIVEISLQQGRDNPQLIFESLNSTGVDLSQADLIRNYILMILDNEEQAKLYKDYWYPIEQNFRRTDEGDQFDRFMRDYLTLKQGTIPNIDKVYVTFKAYHRSQIMKPVKDLVADIARYARYFVNMAFQQEEDKTIQQVMFDINTLKVDVAYPFLLELYDDYTQQRISQQDFIAILRLVESYVFRRAICGIPTNALNKIFATLAKEIDKDHYLESVQAILLSKTGSGRFPTDDEFKAAFVIKDVYNYPRRNYLLRKLENHQHKESIYVEEYTIEHIMPQNQRLSKGWRDELGPNWKEIQARYLHTIGNLTLTGYNSELSDRTFLEKREYPEGGFRRSPLRLNEYLGQLEHWNGEEIEKRAAILAKLAIKVWAMPALSPEQISRFSKPVQKAWLAEAIGPVKHPLAGFVPEHFKIVQSTEKRFYLFREMNGKWIQYGNGKNPSFAISWEFAGGWVQKVYAKNEIPLGIGSEKVLMGPVVTKIPQVFTENAMPEYDMEESYM